MTEDFTEKIVNKIKKKKKENKRDIEENRSFNRLTIKLNAVLYDKFIDMIKNKYIYHNLFLNFNTFHTKNKSILHHDDILSQPSILNVFSNHISHYDDLLQKTLTTSYIIKNIIHYYYNNYYTYKELDILKYILKQTISL